MSAKKETIGQEAERLVNVAIAAARQHGARELDTLAQLVTKLVRERRTYRRKWHESVNDHTNDMRALDHQLGEMVVRDALVKGLPHVKVPR